MLNLIKYLPKLQLATGQASKIISTSQKRNVAFQSNDLWKSVLSVSSQGGKKGRGKGKGSGMAKDLNVGQSIGEGKLKVTWPGLNTNVMQRNVTVAMKVDGIDEDRESRLVAAREKLSNFGSRRGIPPHERGFTGSTLKGKSIGEPLSYDDVDFTGFDTRIIDYKMVLVNKSILGKKKQAQSFVVTGNKDGIIGYGLGKSALTGGAMRLAKSHASHRLLHIERYEDRTIFHNFYEEFYFTKVYAEKMPAGHGLKCHRIIKLVCELVGIKDLYAKVEGSRNPKNIVKAFISGLLNSKKYADIANEKNLHVVEYKPETNFTPTILASPTRVLNKQEEETAKKDEIDKKLRTLQQHDTDLNLYLFNNKTRVEKQSRKPFYYDYPSYKKYLQLKKKENLQKIARLERLKLLDDEILQSNAFPRRRDPRQAKDENEIDA